MHGAARIVPDVRTIRVVALVSGVYDLAAGAALLLGRSQIEPLFGLPFPHPRLYGDLNAVFLMAVAVGYAIPYRDPPRGRAYLWVMGPFLQGAGAIAFLLAYRAQPSPRSLLLFAASDGALALGTR